MNLQFPVKDLRRTDACYEVLDIKFSENTRNEQIKNFENARKHQMPWRTLIKPLNETPVITLPIQKSRS